MMKLQACLASLKRPWAGWAAKTTNDSCSGWTSFPVLQQSSTAALTNHFQCDQVVSSSRHGIFHRTPSPLVNDDNGAHQDSPAAAAATAAAAAPARGLMLSNLRPCSLDVVLPFGSNLQPLRSSTTTERHVLSFSGVWVVLPFHPPTRFRPFFSCSPETGCALKASLTLSVWPPRMARTSPTQHHQPPRRETSQFL